MLIDIVQSIDGNVETIEVVSQYFKCRYVAEEVQHQKWFVYKVNDKIKDIIGAYHGENAKDRAIRLAIDKASQHIAHIVKNQGKKRLTEIILSELKPNKGG